MRGDGLMAYFFGDSFDYYAASGNPADTAGYWDGGIMTSLTTGVTGRFAGSRAMFWSSVGKNLIKISGVNDAVHHINFAVLFSVTGTSNNGFAIWLQDGTTDQCTVTIRGDGTMLIYNGSAPASAGSPLATYPNAVTVANAWTMFEIEVVIHNTAGSFTVRKNGNTVNDFQQTGLNTRTTANNYANRISMGYVGAPSQNVTIDDLIWRSDASTLPWIGDVRAYVSMPVSDAGTQQFSRAPSSLAVVPFATTTSTAPSAGRSYYTPFTVTADGTIGTAVLQMSTGYTGNMKCSIFTSVAGAVTTVLGSATPISNPITGLNTFTFPTPVSVVKGGTYFIGFCPDVSSGNFSSTVSSSTGLTCTTTTYATFPVANPTTSAIAAFGVTVNVTVTANYQLVAEAQQDGTTTYVYDATVGHADLYDLADLPGPATVYAVTTRGFMAKSDAGSRSGQLQIKSGATTVQTTALVLSSSFLWNYRTDTVNPNGGAAWTSSAVNALQVGPVVQA